MSDGAEAGVVLAAGAVVWRPGTRGPEVALVHRPKYDDWSLPKGKCEPGEHVLTTAVREVAEETGLRVILGRPLTPLAYQVSGGIKQVSYWVGQCVESLGFVPGSETDEVIWLPVPAAQDQLTYQRDATLLDEFAAGPARSAPFILLRHASAGCKSADAAEDLARPLDACGSAEASLLASLLSCFGPCRVISSAAERCVATVRPYAAAVGMPVEIDPAITAPPSVASIGDDPPGGSGAMLPDPQSAAVMPLDEAGRQAWQRVAELAAAGKPALVCAHRENLPSLLVAACDALGADVPPGAPLAKGAFWVLQSAAGALVSAEQHQLAE